MYRQTKGRVTKISPRRGPVHPTSVGAHRQGVAPHAQIESCDGRAEVFLRLKTNDKRVPVAPTRYSEPRTFAWFPLVGQSHTINGWDRYVLLDTPMGCLCGLSTPEAPMAMRNGSGARVISTGTRHASLLNSAHDSDRHRNPKTVGLHVDQSFSRNA